MSDRRLAELERRFRATGAVEDELAWLSERVRTGALETRVLELAAHCGHPAALTLLGRDEPEEADDVRWWLRAFSRWGPALGVRAAVAAAQLTLPAWEAEFPTSDLLSSALKEAEVWAPSTARARALEQVGGRVRTAEVGPRSQRAHSAALAVHAACNVAEWTCQQGQRRGRPERSLLKDVARFASDVVGAEHVRRGVSRALNPLHSPEVG